MPVFDAGVEANCNVAANHFRSGALRTGLRKPVHLFASIFSDYRFS